MIKIDYISIQTLCHATEDTESVLRAVRKLYPSFTKQRVTGYFGNPIYIFEAHIKKKREIAQILQLLKVHCALKLRNDLERRIDKKGNLYIRMNKQELCQGNIVLKDDGEVKIIIHIQSYPFRREDAISYAEELFGH